MTGWPNAEENQGKKFYHSPGWPAKRPRAGMGAVLVGYPGQGREPRESDVLGVIPLSLGRIVASVTERHFVLADETQDAYTHAPKGGEGDE
jgi:hypothetical protein